MDVQQSKGCLYMPCKLGNVKPITNVLKVLLLSQLLAEPDTLLSLPCPQGQAFPAACSRRSKLHILNHSETA
jgi:hypothetical protein